MQGIPAAGVPGPGHIELRSCFSEPDCKKETGGSKEKPRHKDGITPSPNQNSPVRYPMNTAADAVMVDKVILPLSCPKKVPVFPSPDRSMAMLSRRGIIICSPREKEKRKICMIKYDGDKRPRTASPRVQKP